MIERDGGSFRLWAVALLAIHLLFTARLAISVEGWQLDEQGHVSVALWIAESGQMLPHFDSVPAQADDRSGWTDHEVGINHPFPYYWAMAAVALPFDGLADRVLAMRMANVLLSGLTVVVVLLLARQLPLSPPFQILFASQFVLMPWVGFLGAHVTNDNLAVFGGALLAFGAWGVLTERPNLRCWLMASGGLLLAGITKGNALFLAGLFSLMLLVVAPQDRKWRRRGPWMLVIAGLLATLPYIHFAKVYGSPIPMTRGIQHSIDYWLAFTGWGSIRLTPAEYFSYFWQKLLGTWNPFLTERTNRLMPQEWHLQVLLLVPVLGFALAASQMAWSAFRLVSRRTMTAMDWLAAIGGITFAITIIVHYWLAYQLHARTGWMNGVWPRYYMPLMLIPALAATAMLHRLLPPRWHQPAAYAGLLALGLVWAAR